MSNACEKIEESEAKPAKFGLFTGKLTAFILLALGQDNYRRFIKVFLGVGGCKDAFVVVIF